VRLLENLTVASLLVRCLATLRDIARSQKRLASAAERALAIDALARGIKPSQLEDALRDAEKDEPVELLTQSEGELAEIARVYRDAEARGVRIPEGEDPLGWLKPEEKEDPFA
jgi:hypothetical protein